MYVCRKKNAPISTPDLTLKKLVFYRAIFVPDQRLTVPFRVDLIWFVLHASSRTPGMTSSNLKIRLFAAVQTNHDFVKG